MARLIHIKNEILGLSYKFIGVVTHRLGGMRFGCVTTQSIWQSAGDRVYLPPGPPFPIRRITLKAMVMRSPDPWNGLT